ncbi:uncharacterized protein A1O9_00994 [Exophiala aquamarina CBS 119918]|uniref:Synembryn-A n=1 Tax=Exophiala aquamarina CBS 119918 TaxID=1182545 RepID=A0A072PSD4_9EURO|nr:uncharacterized protein A1O9_00994 [Exophiala aquamarina CBS 119918]KEF63019.1 hypothetical protein A1O9_00994 [Exophiala aquamarina CBS 119918]
MPSKAQQAEASALLKQLRDDIGNNLLDDKVHTQALEGLKVLGRDAGNVANIYDKCGIETLGHYAFDVYPTSTHQEALRCIANALLLLPQTRKFYIELDLDKKSTQKLQEADVDDEFLLARILFLLTYDPSMNLDVLILENDLATSIINLLSRHAAILSMTPRTTTATQSSDMALQETLKLLFNVTSAKGDQVSRFSSAVPHLILILGSLPILSPPLQAPLSLTLNALANLEIAEENLDDEGQLRPVVDKLTTILDQAVQRYSSIELETLGVPLITTLRKINDIASLDLREWMKSKFLPDDKERDQPLGKSSSLPSRLLRLTTSSGSLHLTEAISGLQFELSNKDANEYVKNVGYGYAAGYLMSHKIPIPESDRAEATEGASSSVPTNPITGQRLDKEPLIEVPNMSQEEREREAERLFVLFERLKATGMVNVKNPVEVAKDAGRFEELRDSDTE